MFCADCGKEVERTIKGSCPACFVERTPLLQVPEVIDLEFCSHCDARRIASRWQDLDPGVSLEWARDDAVREQAAVHRYVEEPYLQLDVEPQDERHFRYTVRLEGDVEHVPVHDQGSTLVRQRNGVCDRCSRMYGNFYAAIIQLRATEREVSTEELERAHKLIGQELDRQRATGNRFAFLTKSGSIHGGWDYYLGDIEAARQVARILKQRLGATVQETAKLVGRKEGEDVHRVTFLVRVRLFAPGDFAEGANRRLLRVLALNHGKAACVSLQHHRKTRVPEASLRRLGGPELIQEAVVVSHTGADLQILDPVTFQTQDVPCPEGFEPGQTVAIIRHDERIYLVPGFK